MTSAVVLSFSPRTPGRIEVRRDGDGWWVFDRDRGWLPVTETVARILTEIVNDIARDSASQEVA